jgi:hypothetical protein
MGMLLAELMRLGFLLTLIAFGIWVGGASVAAWVAWEKGRDPASWFVVAFFLSPLVALLALGAVPARHLARARALRPVALAERKRFDDAGPLAGHAPAEEKRRAVSGASRSW